MTNAELIVALRICGNFADRDGCDEECPYFNDKDCPKRIMCDAADALEAAEKRIAELERILKAVQENSGINFRLWQEAEAQLPKEGEWIFSRGDGKTYADGWTCSACGNSFHTHVPYFEEFHFCPNCGAKMKTVTDCHASGEGEQ